MMIYLTTIQVIEIHDTVIRLSGGFPGVKNNGQLDSVLNNIQNDDWYPSLSDKMAHLMFSIIKSHLFFDGNKRTAIATTSVLLELNGYPLAAETLPVIFEDIVVGIAENLIKKEDIKKLIEDIINETT